MGAGSAGGQALVGIPRVRALRLDPALAAVSRVWPFETGFTDRPAPAGGPWVVHVEAWPGIVPAREVRAECAATGAVRDQAQVRLLCRLARRQDEAGTLGRWFAVPGLDGRPREVAGREEGWILGAPTLDIGPTVGEGVVPPIPDRRGAMPR